MGPRVSWAHATWHPLRRLVSARALDGHCLERDALIRERVARHSAATLGIIRANDVLKDQSRGFPDSNGFDFANVDNASI